MQFLILNTKNGRTLLVYNQSLELKDLATWRDIMVNSASRGGTEVGMEVSKAILAVAATSSKLVPFLWWLVDSIRWD